MILRWSKANGYKDVLAISLPLIASMGSITLMEFTDRVFLANYSLDAISAALPAGISSFLFISFFMGVGNYTNAFVAQYIGAGAPERVGAALWQGIYFSLIASLILASLYFIAGPMFSLIGHPQEIQRLEVTYFRIVICGAGLVVLSSVLSCFYSGRGLTRIVMFIHLAGALVNIPLDYCVINGIGPFPELGIAGAAFATVTAFAVITLLFCLAVFSRKNRQRFGTWRERSLDPELFRRLMRYGLPSGIQMFLEVFSFTFFILMLGRLGDRAMATSNIVLSIESLSFLPMIGMHIGISTLAGQAVGKKRPEDGVYATNSALHLVFIYMVFIAIAFIVFPGPFLALFKPDEIPDQEYAKIVDSGIILLRFVAVYCFFDALNLVYSGTLKGAGDTRFIMKAIGILALTVMILPIYLVVEILPLGLYTSWAILTLYISALGITFMLRYKHGAWKKMQVIEDTAEMEKSGF